VNKLFIIFILKHIVNINGHPSSQCTRAGGGGSRAANSDRGLVLGVGGSQRTRSRAPRGEPFFSDTDSDEAFQISRKLGLVHVEFFCVLVQQLCSELSAYQPRVENLSPAMGRGIDSRNRVWN
jgi:hypothetical protein